MSTRDVVGGYPDGPGSEEAHRPLRQRQQLGAGTLAWALPAGHLSLQDVGRLSARRLRLQIAGLATIVFVVVLTALLRARDVQVVADGVVTTIASRSASETVVIESAGVALYPGDRVDTAPNGSILVHRATEAVLHVDGRSFAVRTQADTIGELLFDAGVSLDPQDSVRRNGERVTTQASLLPPATPVDESTTNANSPPSPLLIDVRRAVPITIVEKGQEFQGRSSSDTVAGAIQDLSVRLGPGDQVRPPLETELSAGLQVSVEHARQVTVTLPEGKTVLYTLEDRVGPALAASGIELPTSYQLNPPANTVIAAGLAIQVVGISQEQELETVRIESYTRYEPDSTLAPGTTRVARGQDGVLYRQYATEYHDDALVSRELAAEWYDPEPVETIIYYSTAPVAPAVSTTAGSWRDLVCSYGWDCEWALAVIQCESAGNPNAYNPAGYVGLFQIWEGHGANLRDPATNIAAAYSLYLSGGAFNWPYCP